MMGRIRTFEPIYPSLSKKGMHDSSGWNNSATNTATPISPLYKLLLRASKTLYGAMVCEPRLSWLAAARYASSLARQSQSLSPLYLYRLSSPYARPARPQHRLPILSASSQVSQAAFSASERYSSSPNS